MTDNVAKIRRLVRVGQVFTPGAPVDRLSMLAGRRTQIMDVVSAVAQKGQHVALYGERGVGKTSLANILAEIFDADDLPDYQAATVNCNTEDNFESLWGNVFRELRLEDADGLSPEDVRYRLAQLDPPALIVLDELDRFEDDPSLSLLADTIKTLSDHIVESTLVLVGVAGSVDELIGEHASVERALVQVEMPRMSRRELREILERGFDYVELSAHAPVVDKITILSEGLPHYTHLLGYYASQRVIADDRREVTNGDLSAAIDQAVAKHTIQSDYQKATRSPRADNLYPQVLLACALASKDALGFFTAGAIRKPLSAIAGRRYEIPAFARHLKQFIQIERGCVLERVGEPRRYFYRFANPLLQPYVILKGLSDGLVDDDTVFDLQKNPSDPVESPRLF